MSDLLLFGRRRTAPSQDALCRVRVGFQGLTIQTREYGPIPAFGPETTTLADDDLDAYVDQCLGAGFTHTEIAVSWNYVERDYAYPVPGRDLSQDLPELHRRIARMIDRGVTGVVVFLAGDGEGDGIHYNDPQGWTYGRGWLMQNFARIYDGLKDLAPWIVWCPGYDGCWYGWRDAQAVRDWWTYCRSVIGPSGVQAFEYAAGLCHLGDGAGTYTGAAMDVDVWLQEFPVGPLPSDNPDQVWQIGARMLGPAYRRPYDEPASDDPRPDWYQAGKTTPRGPWVNVAYEFDTYAWVRRRLTGAQVEEDRAYLRWIGYPVVC